MSPFLAPPLLQAANPEDLLNPATAKIACTYFVFSCDVKSKRQRETESQLGAAKKSAEIFILWGEYLAKFEQLTMEKLSKS